MAKKRTDIKIIYSRLGNYRADGLAWKEDRTIAIDSRLKGKRHLETIIHEIMHIQNPKFPEIMVEGKSKEISDILWSLNFRQVDQ